MSTSHHDKNEPPSGEEHIEVRGFRPELAQGIGDLFRAVYGEGYPIKLFYDTKALTEANAAGQYHSVVACTAAGKVVGVQHLFRSAPHPRLYETGAGLVLPEYRKLGIITRLMQYTLEELAPRQPNIETTFGEAVCNHMHMQKIVRLFSHVETALEIALMPSEAYTTEGSASGRVAALMVFRTFKSRPQTVFLPRAYEQQLRFIYSELDDVRELVLADRELPGDERSEAEMTVFDFAKVARIAVHHTGGDFPNCIDTLEKQAAAQNVVVIQVWVKVSVPWVGAVVDILRGKGYLFGGALPRWFGDDGLLMQKLLVPPNFEDIVLYSDRAKRILDMVRDDWMRTQPTGHR